MTKTVKHNRHVRRLAAGCLALILVLTPTVSLACDPETQNCISTWTEEEHRDAFHDHSDQGFSTGWSGEPGGMQEYSG